MASKPSDICNPSLARTGRQYNIAVPVMLWAPDGFLSWILAGGSGCQLPPDQALGGGQARATVVR